MTGPAAMNEDSELLRRFAQEGSSAAFEELVRRHVDFVYSAALRQLNGDAHLAADAVQLVFTDLARKSAALSGHRVLAGWLFTTTRYTTAKLVRGERRRHARETSAHLMEALNSDPAASLDWSQVRPVLDDVLAALPEPDREAVLLRYFEGRDYASVGAKLQVAENTARMRVDRALDKVRALLERRGVKSTSGALAVALAQQAVISAPAGLATSIAGAALAGGAAAGGALGWMSFMSMSTLQLGLAGAVAASGAAGLVVQAHTNAQLREEIAALRQTQAAVETVQADNLRLARVANEAAEMRRDDAEFARLQAEAATLRTRLDQIARAESARQAQKASSGQIFEISRLDRAPVARFQARPTYPAELRQAGTTGEVVVEFTVDTNGDVVNPRAARSSQPGFEAAAIDAVSKWKFSPGRKGGNEVNTRLQVPIVFSLAGAAAKSAVVESPSPGKAGTVTLTPFTVQASGTTASAGKQ